jgi:hypothetical protein
VRENIGFFSRLFGRHATNVMVREIDSTGLAPFGPASKKLSGGMRRSSGLRTGS